MHLVSMTRYAASDAQQTRLIAATASFLSGLRITQQSLSVLRPASLLYITYARSNILEIPYLQSIRAFSYESCRIYLASIWIRNITSPNTPLHARYIYIYVFRHGMALRYRAIIISRNVFHRRMKYLYSHRLLQAPPELFYKYTPVHHFSNVM